MTGLLVIVFLTLSSNVMAHDEVFILEKLSWIRSECESLMTNHYEWVLGEKPQSNDGTRGGMCSVLGMDSAAN